jgi:CheY-like chemotaxis protein
VSNILIVDDERTILNSFQRFFEEDGYTIFTAIDGKSALKILKTQSIDLALLDVLMPEMTGIDLAKEIRQNPKTKDLKIIFLTVIEKSGREIRRILNELHPEDWLQKPVDAEVLRKAVIKALGGKE